MTVPGIQSTDVVRSDFVDAAELASDGTSVYFSTSVTSTTNGTGTVVVGFAADGEGILYSKDHPVGTGDIAIISGSSGADGKYHVATVVTDTSFTTVEAIPTSTGGTVTFVFRAGSARIGFDPTGQNLTSSNVVENVATDTANHELLDNEPVGTGAIYSVTRSASRVTQEKWVKTIGSNVIKTIDYTYTGRKVTQEVRKVFDAATGLVVIAQVTITYSYSGNIVTGDTVVRNV